MTVDGMFLMAVLRLATSLLIALLGVLVLWRGRRLPWLFSGAAGFLLGIMAVRFLDPVLGGRLTDVNGLAWGDLVPIIAAVLGVLAGRYRQDTAYALMGLPQGEPWQSGWCRPSSNRTQASPTGRPYPSFWSWVWACSSYCATAKWP